MQNALQLVETLRANHCLLLANPNYSEADTVTHLIDPVLSYLGYPASQQLRENQVNKNRPDIVLWNVPYALRGDATANAILEAKPLNHDLDGKGLARADRPKTQIKRYVNGYAYSGPGTYGILTDGNIWHVIQRSETEQHTPLIMEWQLLEGTEAEAATSIEEIDRILKGTRLFPGITHHVKADREAYELCQAIADGKSAASILRLLTKKDDYKSDIKGEVSLVGKAQEAEASQWAEYAYTEAGRIKADQGDMEYEPISVAVVRTTKADSTQRLQGSPLQKQCHLRCR